MKAALYIRVSTHHQIDKDSLPFQRGELVNYAKYVLGIEDYEIFEDAGFSGKNTDRPAYQDMMTKIKNREFTHLLVWKIDRISRNLLDFCAMYDEIKSYGVTFISRNEQFDTSSAMGETMLKIILIFAELERKLTAERVTSIMLNRAEKGLWNGANVPIGYLYDEETKFPKIDFKEAETVKYIYDTYQEYESTAEVTSLLNNNNIPTKRGGIWTSKTVGDIIRNPFYKGTYRYNYRESARGSKKKEDEWIIIEDNHEGIISKEQWELCNSIMDKNAKRNNAHHRKNANTHVFAGLLECDNCHRIYIAQADKLRKDGWRPSTYRCAGKRDYKDCDSAMSGDLKIGDFVINYIANYIRANNTKFDTIEELEKILLKNISNKLTENSLKVIYDSLKNSSKNIILSNKVKTKKVSNNNLSSEKEKYKRALSRLEDLYLFDDEGISEKDYIIKKKKIEDKLKEIENEIKDSNNTKQDNIDLSILNSSVILKNEMLYSDYINYKELDMLLDRKLLKEFINNIIEKIVINHETGMVKSILFKNGLTGNFITD